MDEFTSIALWFLIVILSLNAAILYIDGSQTFVDAGISLNITPNDDIQNITYDVNSDTNNSISSSTTIIPRSTATDMIGGWSKVANGIRLFFTAWLDLIWAIFLPIPGGTFFALILIPILGMIQAVALFVVAIRVAGVIRGII